MRVARQRIIDPGSRSTGTAPGRRATMRRHERLARLHDRHREPLRARRNPSLNSAYPDQPLSVTQHSPSADNFEGNSC